MRCQVLRQMVVGARVVRGLDWKWRDQDGNPPGLFPSLSAYLGEEEVEEDDDDEEYEDEDNDEDDGRRRKERGLKEEDEDVTVVNQNGFEVMTDYSCRYQYQ